MARAIFLLSSPDQLMKTFMIASGTIHYASMQ
jgi:hypothetical protein